MIITFFKNEWETYTPANMAINTSWDEVASILTTLIIVDNKEDTEMYNLWEFRHEDDIIHRCKADCLFLHGLVLDFDRNLTMEEAVTRFDGLECVVYTTFNHSPELEKFRVVFPFTHPLSISDFDCKRQSMINTFVGADKASFSRSQAIFLHSAPSSKHAISFHMSGKFIDPSIFEDEIIEDVIINTTPRNEVLTPFEMEYRKTVIKSLGGCKGIRYLDAMGLVTILKSCGASLQDFQLLVRMVGAKDSCIQDNDAQIATWNAVDNNVRIGREKRDKFIRRFGGTPPVAKRKQTSKELLEKIMEKYT